MGGAVGVGEGGFDVVGSGGDARASMWRRSSVRRASCSLVSGGSGPE
ncbi:MAG: hypothetical protein ACYTE5_00550 [Planctomycetota bacterium]